MKEMMLNIESIESKTTNQEQIYMLTALKIAALVLLEKEKEQIIEAYIDGNFIKEEFFNPEEYYKQTYNQNNICQHCNEAKLLIVEADEPFSNKHLACPNCDSTFTYNQNK